MTDLTKTAPGRVQAPTTPTREPALITEQQVLFSTAAVAPAKTRRWTDAVASVADAVRTYFEGPTEPARRHHPTRRAYLENALLAREMDRL